MSSRSTGSNIVRIIRIASLALILFYNVNLFCGIRLLGECPVTIEYKFFPLDLSWEVGSRYLITYTISIDPQRVTSFDRQRKYSLQSEYLSKYKNYGTYRTISTDIENDEVFTYDQFPITGHLKVRDHGGNGTPYFPIYVYGYTVEEDTLHVSFDGLQQVSQLVVSVVADEEYYTFIDCLRIALISLLVIVPITVIILIWRRKRGRIKNAQ